MKRLLLAFLLLGVSLFVGCGGSSGGSTPPPTATLQSITITPSSPTISAGSTQQFSATGTYSDGSTKAVAANWLSAPSSVATINTSGLATGVAAGTGSISASSGSIVGTTTLTVTNPLVSITVTPATATVAPKGQQQFIATGNYAFGPPQDITSSVTWSASLGATITAGGLATGVTPNTTSTIMAAQGNISATAVLTITNPLVSIAVTPLTQSVAVGFTQSFTATGTYADGTTSVLTSTVTWASSTPPVAKISNSAGTQGLATGIAPGNTSITATLGPITSLPAALTVTNATLTSIAVAPATASIELGYQQTYAATGTFSDGSTLTITTSVTWTSSDTTKVAINGFVATGVAVTSSPVTITATKGSVTGTAALSVVPPNLTSIAITPAAATLAQGTSRLYSATGTRSNGSTLNITSVATWTSSDITIATVGLHTGRVIAAKNVTLSSNSVTISVAYSGVTQTLLLNVSNETPTFITVTPVTATIPAFVTQPFTATASFPTLPPQDVSLDASWTSSDPTVATVSFGRASSLKSGPATITATFPPVTGKSGTAQLTVSTATLQSISVTPLSTLLAPGSTVSYQAVGTYSDTTTQYLSALATWSSSNTTVVTVTSNTGIATGILPGQATISATYQGITSNAANVVVSQFPLTAIAVTPTTASVPFGVSTPFTATGTFSDLSTQNLTTSATWASSQSSVATVSNNVLNQGVATGVAPGQTSISAVFAGQVGTAPLTVTNATIVSVAVTPNPASANVGTQVSFTATGTFSDGSSVNLTNQVTWSSSNATVATIISNGQANTASAGTTNITATFTQSGTTVQGTTVLTVH